MLCICKDFPEYYADIRRHLHQFLCTLCMNFYLFFSANFCVFFGANFLSFLRKFPRVFLCEFPCGFCANFRITYAQFLLVFLCNFPRDFRSIWFGLAKIYMQKNMFFIGKYYCQMSQ